MADKQWQYFCPTCGILSTDPHTTFCPTCRSRITPSRMERLVDEELEKIQAFHSTQRPAPKSAIEKMAGFEITENLLERQPICPICQHEFKIGTMVRGMPCGHFFHEECIVSWLSKRNICPVCEATLRQEQKIWYKPPGRGGGGGSSSGTSCV